MHRSEAIVRTAEGSKYLQQLCKHFAHKITVEYDATNGVARFPFGECRMVADSERLTLTCEAPDADAAAVMHRVIDEHLVKFAWRETLDITWNRTDAAAA